MRKQTVNSERTADTANDGMHVRGTYEPIDGWINEIEGTASIPVHNKRVAAANAAYANSRGPCHVYIGSTDGIASRSRHAHTYDSYDAS